MIIDPILQQYRAVMRAALQEHMNLVTSQYMTGYARASRESGIGAAMPMDPPNLSDISDVNPVTTPDQTPKTKSRLPAYAGIVPSPTSFSSVASLAKRRAAPNDEDNEPEPEPEGRNIDPTMAKELWERSATDSNAEVAKGWAMLINQLQTAGNMLAEELWLLKYHLCRQNMSQGITLPLRVPTKDNNSDCGTKCQSAPDFTKLRKRLTGYAKSYTPPEWEPLPLPAWTPITELPNTIDDG